MRHDSAMESARNGCPRRLVDVPETPLILLDCAEIHAGFFAQFTLSSEGGRRISRMESDSRMFWNDRPVSHWKQAVIQPVQYSGNRSIPSVPRDFRPALRISAGFPMPAPCRTCRTRIWEHRAQTERRYPWRSSWTGNYPAPPDRRWLRSRTPRPD